MLYGGCGEPVKLYYVQVTGSMLYGGSAEPVNLYYAGKLTGRLLLGGCGEPIKLYYAGLCANFQTIMTVISYP